MHASPYLRICSNSNANVGAWHARVVWTVPSNTHLTCSKSILPLQVLGSNQLHIDQGIGLGAWSTTEPPTGSSLGQLTAKHQYSNIAYTALHNGHVCSLPLHLLTQQHTKFRHVAKNTNLHIHYNCKQYPIFKRKIMHIHKAPTSPRHAQHSHTCTKVWKSWISSVWTLPPVHIHKWWVWQCSDQEERRTGHRHCGGCCNWQLQLFHALHACGTCG